MARIEAISAKPHLLSPLHPGRSAKFAAEVPPCSCSAQSRLGPRILQILAPGTIPMAAPGGSFMTVRSSREIPQQVVGRGGIAQIPLLVTTTRDEMNLFELVQGTEYAPSDEGSLLVEMERYGVENGTDRLNEYRRRSPDAPPARLRSMFLTDAIYRWPAERLAAAQVAAGGHAFMALFAAEPFGPVVGACHASDLPYVFGNFQGGLLAAPDEPAHHAISAQVIDAWSRFARTGDPGWDEFDPEDSYSIRQFESA